MANDDDLDELLDRLAERLKTIREDAELARSVGYQGISAALDRTQVRLNDLAHSLEALCLQVEQQHANAERFEATAAKGEAESQALKQTVEALSVRLQQQAEMLDGLSRRKRSGPRIGLVIAILLGGSIAAFRGSGQVASFGSLQGQMVDWLSEVGGINLSSSTRPKIASTAPNSESVSDAQGVVAPSASVAFDPMAPASTDSLVATGGGSIPPALSSPAPAPPLDPKLPMQMPVAIVPLPPPSSAVTNPQLPETAVVVVPNTGSQFSWAGEETPTQVSAASEPSSGQSPAAETSPHRESLAPVATMPTAGLRDSSVGAEEVMMESSAAPEPSESSSGDVLQPSATSGRISTTPVSHTVPAALIPTNAKQNARRQLVLKATADSWVRVRASDDRAIFSRTMRKGETYRIAIDAGSILDTGNAAGLEVEVEGMPVLVAGGRAGVVRNVPLDTTLGGSASRP
jgi:hypothetical protein